MTLPPEVRAIVRTRLAPEIATAYLNLARPSIGYAPADEGWSAFGGDPSVAAFVWPWFQGRPMLMLAQIDCAESVELLGREWPFPAEGRLLFFHDDDFSAGFPGDHGDDGCQVLHVADAPVAPLPEPRRTIPALPLVPTARGAIPNWHDDLAEHLGLTIRELIDLSEDLTPHLPKPRHRLLGYHDNRDIPVTGHRPLLQLAAEEGTTWGAVTSVTFWITEADLRTGILANVRRSYASP
ncbi:DUF1963 domain-containing protein [Actinoplanes awajinensis]|uniref:DUF1963 domain-containing protein n=1 Tax=Actinoplanes awajinensis subsp. mycoplanecinus TaxID=135947 RepID=A0A101JND6_9ACTN|nr:DUF1963 domain-containing protein [Actinoplanes awajinensis]KUL30004.1 hypothetical protein ADL15_25875 [Actinoplanes awajinensis subsp. mycoplanecinus]